MNVTLDYGSMGLEISIPQKGTTVIEPNHPPPVADQKMAILHALRNPVNSLPLRQIAKRGATVGISICDITRAQPRKVMLEALLEEMTDARLDDITVFIATGTHKGATPEEIEEMLGSDIARSVNVSVHDARNDAILRRVADTARVTPVLLNRAWLECDIRITTGFVEPHFFAGFSGGPKMVAPGLAGLETVLELHNFARIADTRATWGITHGNPIHDDIREIVQANPVDFAVDVTLNREKKITSVFAGELFSEHRAACALAKRAAMRPVEAPFDVVVTSNSGYPLDQNLYQAVKGMSAAAKVVKEKGVVICASECRDGLPDHGEYAAILHSASSPADMLRRIKDVKRTIPDQWEAQIQANIQIKANVWLKADGLSTADIRAAHLVPIEDLNEAVERALSGAGRDASLCVLPQGPQTIPYFGGSGAA